MTDLAVILIAAGVFTVIFKLLKQPLILGYIIAGFLVGPHLGIFPELTSHEAVSQWSEIGIIFLLFSLGLEFSFKKLLKVGSSALIMAGTKCIGMFIIGLVVGNAIGWTMMESIFLGGLLSMSSTTIIIKAYDDMGLKNKPYASLIFGSLVVEDLIAVLLLVLLSTLAVSNKFAGGEMLMGIAKLAFFLVLWFLVGIFVIPSLLKAAKKYLSDEILLIVSIGLCFMMVALASLAGFSSALGAFVMGSILAETIEAERINKLIGGIKDLFGAIFFVSVGMMLDPSVIAQHWGIILIITVVAMAGILVFSTSGGLIAGEGLDTSVHAGFSLAQLGEFAFIIASLGCSLGVMRDFIYPVIIAISVITTFTTPYMIKASTPVTEWLYKVLPARFLAVVEPRNDEKRKGGAAEKSEWKNFLKGFFIRIALYSVICIAICLGAPKIFGPLAEKFFPTMGEGMRNLICCAAQILVLSPFLYGLGINSRGIIESSRKLISNRSSNRWPIASLILLRALILVSFVVVSITQYSELDLWAFLVLVAAFAAAMYLGKMSLRTMPTLEKRFFRNLNEKEELEKQSHPVAASLSSKMAGYDVHMESIDISADSAFVGKALRELPFRHKSGANIMKIQRGSRSILVPGGDEIIYPGDTLLAVGSTEQINSFRELMSEKNELPQSASGQDFIVRKHEIEKDSLYEGKSLRELSLRSFGCMVVSVLRDEDFIMNPAADFVFRTGDVIWVAGEKEGVINCTT